MARSKVEGDVGTTPVMHIGALIGRVVWTSTGERLGIIRDVDTGPDGEIQTLRVRDRWLLGQQQEIPAAGMRIDGEDVIVAARGVTLPARAEVGHGNAAGEQPVHATPSGAPVILAGRAGIRPRFGGLDIVSSLFGALVTIGALAIIGGILVAAFGTTAMELDLSVTSFGDMFVESMVIGGVALFLACLLGGWATGRSARFDGVGNALVSVVWVLAFAVGAGALTAWIGDEYDVLSAAGMPTVLNDELAFWGVISLVVAVALMLIGAALGGALGESWHRRADRAMLDVVSVGGEHGESSATGLVGSPVAPQSSLDVDPDATTTGQDASKSSYRRHE